MPHERFWRDASGRLTFDAPGVEAVDHSAVCRAVADTFALAPCSSLTVGPDQMFWDFRRAEQVVGLDWDIWMGLLVVAKTEGAQLLVRDIGAWLGASQRLEAGRSSGEGGPEEGDEP